MSIIPPENEKNYNKFERKYGRYNPLDPAIK